MLFLFTVIIETPWDKIRCALKLFSLLLSVIIVVVTVICNVVKQLLVIFSSFSKVRLLTQRTNLAFLRVLMCPLVLIAPSGPPQGLFF